MRNTLHAILGMMALASPLGLAATPLVINPRAYLYGDAFFTPKWSWIAAMALAGFCALAARTTLARLSPDDGARGRLGSSGTLGAPIMFHLDPVWLCVCVFFALHLASVAWSRSPSLALERSFQIGALTLGMGVGLNVLRTRRRLITLARVFVATCTATAFWTLGQDFAAAWWPEKAGVIPNLPDWRGYLSAGLGNTNHIGDLLALGLLVALLLFGESRKLLPLLAYFIALVAVAMALTVCYSVGSNLGLVLGASTFLAILLARRGTRFFRKRKRWALLGLAWGAMILYLNVDVAANPHRPGILRQGFGSERWIEGGETRLVIWAGGLEMLRLHPWVGVGAGNFTYVYPEMRSGLIEGNPELQRYEGSWTNAAHNLVLQTWAELGVLGLFVLIAIFGAAFYSLLRGIRWAPREEFLIRMGLAGLLVAYLGHGVMNFALQQPSGAVSLYLLLLATCVEKRARRESASGLPPLIADQGWGALRVEWKEMGKPTAVGFMLRVPPRLGLCIAAVWMALLCVGVAILARPVIAESRYGLASVHRRQGQPELEEKYLVRALELNPRATGARSRYAEFLLEQRRPEEALEQLTLVRKRLNSRELWERESRAYGMLGRKEEAREAWAVYQSLLPRP